MIETEAKADPKLNKDGQLRFSLRSLLVFVTIASLLIAGVAWFVKSLHYGIVEGPLDCYATMYGVGTTRTYLQRNNDQWPSNWDDLKPIFDERYKLGEDAITFDELKQRLEIDFAVDPEELSRHELKLDEIPFRVFRLRNGRTSHWKGVEPNSVILKYLKSRFPKN